MPRRVRVICLVDGQGSDASTPELLVKLLHGCGMRLVRAADKGMTVDKNAVPTDIKDSENWITLWYYDLRKRALQVMKSRTFSGRQWWKNAPPR